MIKASVLLVAATSALKSENPTLTSSEIGDIGGYNASTGLIAEAPT
jgi:hypothetical protein